LTRAAKQVKFPAIQGLKQFFKEFWITTNYKLREKYMVIRTYQELLDVLTLQKQNLGTYFTQCNASAADVTEITAELTNLTSIASYAEIMDGYKKTVFEMKQTLYNGELSESIAPFPAIPPPPLLAGALAGALTRTRDRNRRFKAGPGYTELIGEALGIGSGDPSSGTEPTAPTIEVTAAQMGYLYSVVVSNRQQSDQWEVLIQPVGSSTWTTAGSATGKSSDFTYNPGPTAGDNPIQLRVMVQLKKNNANYADPSQQVVITVNP